MAVSETDAKREAMVAMMAMLSTQITATSVLADELVAASVAAAGTPLATAMLSHARRYRIDVLELQGRLAALSSDYVQRFRAGS